MLLDLDGFFLSHDVGFALLCLPEFLPFRHEVVLQSVHISRKPVHGAAAWRFVNRGGGASINELASCDKKGAGVGADGGGVGADAGVVYDARLRFDKQCGYVSTDEVAGVVR